MNIMTIDGTNSIAAIGGGSTNGANSWAGGNGAGGLCIILEIY